MDYQILGTGNEVREGCDGLAEYKESIEKLIEICNKLEELHACYNIVCDGLILMNRPDIVDKEFNKDRLDNDEEE